MSGRTVEEYQVGWVCALSKELTAARAMLDEEHDDCYSRQPQDFNSYVLGRMHNHNVVIACLPAGTYGTTSAATVANSMLRTFTGIRFGLMVGIGGGIPNLDRGWDIRLGDVVVSQPDGTHGGVVQYDLRKNLSDGGSELKGFLQSPPTHLLTALANLQSRHSIQGHKVVDILSETLQKFPRLAQSAFTPPKTVRDSLQCCHTLNRPDVVSCPHCEHGVVRRKPRHDTSPQIHYGNIVSGNELMKNAIERDRLGQKFGAKCIEMEAAGLMNNFPCLVIRGISDYADSSKNDLWQEYAAATAAAFAKELLSVIKPIEVNTGKQATKSTSEFSPLRTYSYTISRSGILFLDKDVSPLLGSSCKHIKVADRIQSRYELFRCARFGQRSLRWSSSGDQGDGENSSTAFVNIFDKRNIDSWRHGWDR